MREEFEAALATAVSAIKPLDPALIEPGQAHLDDLTKPRGSLGKLEELALRLYRISGGKAPAAHPSRVYVVAGDHGVAAEGVSPFPQEVTRQMVANFLNGGAAINALATANGVGLKVVDAGSVGGAYPEHPDLIQRKLGLGTANLAKGPAMSREQTLAALNLGLDLAAKAQNDGIKAVATGEMGIANTTPSTALYCAFLGLAPEDVTGPGAGLDKAGVARKAEVVQRGLEANAAAVISKDPLNTLAALGGLEIATLAGLVLGAASRRMAVAVDGFISTAAVLSAVRICPAAAEYCFFAHASAEPGHIKALQAMNAEPLLHLGMRLGEGSGAVLALMLLKSAAAMFNEMATFSGAGVSKA